MANLKLGIIGLSDGNGHPYSWSAIFNGYDRNYMKQCPFPVIPQYLSQQTYPDDFLNEARVTHIWTQDRAISEHVAKASKINVVVDHMEDMIGEVDGILLARDDAEYHLQMSQCFIEAGLPIYIDKPLAQDLTTAEKIFSLERYEGQIFSCSAMRYAREVEDFLEKRESLGRLLYIDACVMKKWHTYSPHIIDPVLRIIGEKDKILSHHACHNQTSHVLSVQWESGLSCTFSSHDSLNTPLLIRVFAENGYCEISMTDTFYAFRGALSAFVQSISNPDGKSCKREVLRMIDLIEKGLK